MTPTALKSLIEELQRAATCAAKDVPLVDLLTRAHEAIEGLLPLPTFGEVPYTDIIGLYHKYLPASPKVRTLTTSRRRSLGARWREDADRQNLTWWDRFFQTAAQSDFLTGRRPNDRNWVPDFDFFLQPKSMTRVIEGYYGGRRGGDGSQSDYLESIRQEQQRRVGAP